MKKTTSFKLHKGWFQCEYEWSNEAGIETIYSLYLESDPNKTDIWDLLNKDAQDLIERIICDHDKEVTTASDN